MADDDPLLRPGAVFCPLDRAEKGPVEHSNETWVGSRRHSAQRYRPQLRSVAFATISAVFGRVHLRRVSCLDGDLKIVHTKVVLSTLDSPPHPITYKPAKLRRTQDKNDIMTPCHS